MDANRNDILKPRPQIEGFEPYLPGRSMDQVRKQYGLISVIKLASNENPLGPSPRAVAAMKKAAGRAHLYPDGFSTELKTAMAKFLGVKISEISLGTGSDELIEILGRAYLNPGDEIVVSEHAFSRYKMSGDLMGASVASVPMKGFTHDLDAMARAVTPKTKFVFVANPNNPTGTYNTAAEMERFLDAISPTAVPVIDEAYFEYARMRKDYPSALDAFKKGRTLLLLRTFSKIHGLAGVRVGYAVGPAALINTLERVRPPFNVSSVAQAAAAAALLDTGQVRRSLRLMRSEKPKLEKTLGGMNVPFVPSAANFLLIDVFPLKGRDVFEALMKKGVIIRAMDEYGFPHHIRVTVGLPKENQLFIKALKEVVGAEAQRRRS